MLKQALLFSCYASFTLLSVLKSQAQDVNSVLSEKLRKSVNLKFVSRDLIDMTNTFYENLPASSNQAMYLSLHVVLEDRKNGEVYGSFVLSPMQQYGRIRLIKEITPRIVNNIEVKFFYDAYSATHDVGRVYWEIKQGQLGRALWEFLQLYIFRDRDAFEKLLKYFSEGLERDQFSPPPNPLEFIRSLFNLFSTPDFNKLPEDIQNKLKFIVDRANDPQYIKGISYNLKYFAHNLGALKVTPILIAGAGVQASGFALSNNSNIIRNFELAKVPFALRGMVGLPTEHRISVGTYGRFYLSGFYEQVAFKSKTDVFVGRSYILQPNVQSQYEVLGQTKFDFANYGAGLTYAVTWKKYSSVNFEAGIARVNGKIRFSETSLSNGLTLKSKEFDTLESTNNFSPYWEIDLEYKQGRWRTNVSMRFIYNQIDYKKDFELSYSRSFNKLLLGNQIRSLQLGLNIDF